MRRYDLSIVGTQGIKAKYGGFETLCQYLCEGFNNYNDIKVSIYCSSKAIDKNEPLGLKNIKRIFLPFNANGLESIIYDYISILHSIFTSKKILILGVSGCTILPFIRLFGINITIITHLDGIEWQRNKWNFFVSLFLRLSELIAVIFSTNLIADNEGIKDYIKKQYGVKYLKKTKMLFYGANKPSGKTIKKNPYLINAFSEEEILLPCKKYYLVVCRAEPENNIKLILNTFKNVPESNLLAFCNWKNNSYGENLLKEYHFYKNIFLVEPNYDRKIITYFRENAVAYIHGHSVGGTNPSLVESIGAYRPIFSFDVSFNRYTLFNTSYYWKNEEQLRNLLSVPEERLEIAVKKGYSDSFFEKYYRWEKVVASYGNLFF